jgi:hypothetical protein
MAITLLAKISNITGIGKSLLSSSQSKIGELFIDATHMEEIQYSNQITDHPVERGFDSSGGSSISDHVYKNPLRLKLEGSITDTPIDVIGTAKSVLNLFDGNLLNNIKDKFNGKGRKQITAYEILKDIHINRSVVDVVNYWDTFENMVIETLTFPRDNRTGNRLKFEITLKQITLASVKKVDISNNPSDVQDLLGTNNKLGNQETKGPTPTQINSTKSSIFLSGARNIKQSLGF